jgi:hypothetical protein
MFNNFNRFHAEKVSNCNWHAAEQEISQKKRHSTEQYEQERYIVLFLTVLSVRQKSVLQYCLFVFDWLFFNNILPTPLLLSLIGTNLIGQEIWEVRKLDKLRGRSQSYLPRIRIHFQVSLSEVSPRPLKSEFQLLRRDVLASAVP